MTAMTGEQIEMFCDRTSFGRGTGEAPEEEIISVSIIPQGSKMTLRIACSLHIDFGVYESVRDEIMLKILEMKKIVREAEARLDI